MEKCYFNIISKAINNEVINLISPARTYKFENRAKQTSGYTEGGIRRLGGVSIPYRPVTHAVSPISKTKISVSKSGKSTIKSVPPFS
jgi:hypothetical protein